MKWTQSIAVAGLAAATGANAETHVVKAVAKPSFAFTPNIVQAEVGDYIEFHFGPANHSVAKGTFSKPCAPTHHDGFFSGYLPVAEGEVESDKVFKVLIENTDPIVFYCTQGSHCASGMFGVVNPTEEQSGEAYAGLVAQLEGGKAIAPKKVPFGGALIDNPSLAEDSGDDGEDDGEDDDASATGGNTARPTATQGSGAGATDPAVTAPGSDTPPASEDSGTGESAGSTETNIPGSGAGSVWAPMAGLVGAVAFAVLLG